MIDKKILLKKAFEPQIFSYDPYSNFNVCAAILCADWKKEFTAIQK